MPRPMPVGRRRALRTLLAFLTALTVPLTFALTWVGPAAAATTRYEAETAVCQGTVDSDHTGFSGTGFCNTTNAVGVYVEWTVNSVSAGTATAAFRYANGTTANRPMTITVNGTAVGTLNFPPTASWDTWATATLPVNLVAGTNTIRATATTSAGGPNLDYLEVTTTQSAGTRYEAENAVCQGTVDSDHTSFSGTGFCNTTNAVGSYVEWTVDTAAAGTGTLTFRFANGTTTNRPMTITVNGATLTTLNFPGNSSWDTWQTATATAALSAGSNKIRATATTSAGGPNLDYLGVDIGIDTTPPSVPGNPRTSNLACDSVTFAWDASTDNAGVVAYDIYHDGQFIKSVDARTLSTTLTVVAQVTWGLYVNARDTAGNVSQASNTVNVTPPACQVDTEPPTAPTNLAGSVAATTITLNWGASTDNVGVTAYDVYRDSSLAGTVSGSPPATTFTDAGLAANTTYTYYVVARDRSGNVSPHSNPVSLKTGSSCTNPVCQVTTLTTDTDIPWGLVTLPDGTILYNRRDAHDIIHLNPATGAKNNIGTVPNVQSTDGEGGLLGLEINPVSFSSDHWLYIMHTSSSDNRIVRIKYENGTLQTSSEQILVTGILRNKYHDGGRLRFSPDGSYLFAGTGDAQNGDNAQNRNNLNGKVLRINPDGSIPSDNPFGNAVWSYGHRNVQGLAFDSQGRLWEQEFGNSIMDETNLIVKGGNYGWPICEGTANGTGSCGQSGLIAPKHTYPVADGSCSGITIVRDVLYVACLRGERMYRLVISGSSLINVTQYFQGTYGRLRTVEPAPDGGIWLTTSNGDKDSTPNNSSTRVMHVTLGQ
jgi:glucose/arabinose dehydrogenase